MTASKTRTVIPALPGWYVAVLIEGDEGHGDELVFDPIVAWEVERYEEPYHQIAKRPPGEMCVTHGVIPITLEGDPSGANPWAIKTPDGKLDIPGDRVVDTEADCIRELGSILQSRYKERMK